MPSLSLASTATPCATRSGTMQHWPMLAAAAACSSVLPAAVVMASPAGPPARSSSLCSCSQLVAYAIALYKAVSPRWHITLTSAPCCSNSSHAASCPAAAAACKGVVPLLLFVLSTGAPAASSMCMTVTKPRLAAICIAVSPPSLHAVLLRSAPLSCSNTSITTSPFRAARCITAVAAVRLNGTWTSNSFETSAWRVGLLQVMA